MNCPKCASEELVNSQVLGNIPLDHCVGCGGIWFDKEELEKLLRQSQGALPAELELIDPKAEGLACPRCRGKMSRGGLVNPLLLVDKCPSCGGVWLDARELALLKKQLGLAGGATEVSGLSRPPARPPAPMPVFFRLKPVPLFCSVLGLVGVSLGLYYYLAPADQKPWQFSARLVYSGFAVSALLLGYGAYSALTGGKDR